MERLDAYRSAGLGRPGGRRPRRRPPPIDPMAADRRSIRPGADRRLRLPRPRPPRPLGRLDRHPAGRPRPAPRALRPTAWFVIRRHPMGSDRDRLLANREGTPMPTDSDQRSFPRRPGGHHEPRCRRDRQRRERVAPGRRRRRRRHPPGRRAGPAGGVPGPRRLPDRARPASPRPQLPARHVIHTVGPVYEDGELGRSRPAPLLLRRVAERSPGTTVSRRSPFPASRPASMDTRRTRLARSPSRRSGLGSTRTRRPGRSTSAASARTTTDRYRRAIGLD